MNSWKSKMAVILLGAMVAALSMAAGRSHARQPELILLSPIFANPPPPAQCDTFFLRNARAATHTVMMTCPGKIPKSYEIETP